MNNLVRIEQVFSYGDAQVRVIMKDGEPLFVAKDVCDVLGLSQPVKAVERLDEDEVNSIHVTDSLGRLQPTYVVNEPGLYSLILGSRKPQAKAFKRWITHEVIPSIRKTGSYSIQQHQYKLPMTYVEALEAHLEAVKRAEEAERQLALAVPKVELHDRLMATTNAQTMEQVAKALGIGRNTLFAFLRAKGIFAQANLNT